VSQPCPFSSKLSLPRPLVVSLCVAFGFLFTGSEIGSSPSSEACLAHFLPGLCKSIFFSQCSSTKVVPPSLGSFFFRLPLRSFRYGFVKVFIARHGCGQPLFRCILNAIFFPLTSLDRSFGSGFFQSSFPAWVGHPPVFQIPLFTLFRPLCLQPFFSWRLDISCMSLPWPF